MSGCQCDDFVWVGVYICELYRKLSVEYTHQRQHARADLIWLGGPAGHTGLVSRLGFEDAVVSKEAQDDALAAALWLRSAELVGLPE